MAEIYRALINRWRLIVLLMVLCGTAGTSVSRVLPKGYLAKAELPFSINTNMSGTLSDIESDRMIGVMEDIIQSQTVAEAVCTKSGECEPDKFREVISVTRTFNSWTLSYPITADDPQTAADVLTAWLRASHAALSAAKEASLQVQQYDRLLSGLSGCLNDSIAIPSAPACPTDSMVLNQEIERLVKARSDAETRSLGVSPALNIMAPNYDDISISQTGQSTGFYALIGIAIGLLLGLILALSGSDKRGPVPQELSD